MYIDYYLVSPTCSFRTTVLLCACRIAALEVSYCFQVQGLKKELGNIRRSRKEASASLRMALQKAAQSRLMEKEKNKSPSYAMRISLRINKVVWGMLSDGKSFAEAEINSMVSVLSWAEESLTYHFRLLGHMSFILLFGTLRCYSCIMTNK